MTKNCHSLTILILLLILSVPASLPAQEEQSLLLIQVDDLEVPKNIYFDQELPVRMSVRTTGGAFLAVHTIDYFEKPVFADTIPIGGESLKMVTMLDKLHYGYMVTTFTTLDAAKNPGESLQRPFCVVRKPLNWGVEDPDSRFGYHDPGNASDVEAVERIGMKWSRIYHWWRFDERTKGNKSSTRMQGLDNMNNEYHMGSVMCIRPEDPPQWAKDEDYINNPKSWEDYTKYMVGLGMGRGIVYEIGNEPDLKLRDLLGADILTTGKVYRDLAERSAIIIKCMEPDAKIIVCSTAGMHMGASGYAYTETSFSTLHKYADIFGTHPYTGPRYVGGAKDFISPEEKDNRRRYKEIFHMIDKYGKGRHVVWATECGYAIDQNNKAFIDDMNRTFTSLNARMFITSFSVPRVEKAFHFRTTPTTSEGGYDYGLFRAPDNSPRPTMPMFSHMAHVMHRVEPMEPPIKEDDRQIFAFESEGGTGLVIAYKHKGDPENMTLDIDPSAIRVTDLMGNTIHTAIPGGISQVELTDQPIYIESIGLTADELKLMVSGAEFSSSKEVVIENAYLRSLAELSIELRNNRATASEVFLTLQAPEGLQLDSTAMTLSLAPAELREISLGMHMSTDPTGLAEEEIVISAASGTGESVFRLSLELHPVEYTEVSISLDNLDSVRDNLGHLTFRGRYDVMPSDPGISWNGDDDLSSDFYFGWDSLYLFLVAEVNDDNHHNPWVGADLVKGDALQVSLDTRNDASCSLPGYDDNDLELVVAIDSGVVKGYLPQVPAGTDMETLLGAITTEADRSGNKTRYLVSIPWESLGGIVPAEHLIVGLNMVAGDNDNTGISRDYWNQISSGTVESTKPSLYRKFILVK